MTIPPDFFKDPRVWAGAGLALFLAIKFLGSHGQPKEQFFTCARCKRQAEHNPRTTQAWRDGKDRFFCPACHHIWLERRRTSPAPVRGRTGCLIFLILGAASTASITYEILS